MDYLNQQYLEERIKRNQRFLLKLLNLHIFNYYPLRRYLGISIGNKKIDEISHLSWAYDTKYFKKGNKWYKQQTRTYQQPDLGYKLNLVLDKIPQLAISALLQPAYGLGALALFFLTTYTYQPTTADTYIAVASPNSNYGTLTYIDTQRNYDPDDRKRILLYFDTTDIPDGATFSQGDVSLYLYQGSAQKGFLYRLTRTNWTEEGATWNKYDGTNNWTTAGGDYTTTNGVSKITPSAPNWLTFNAANLIQDCYDNQSKSVHLLLRSDEATAGGDNLHHYYSREYATDTSLRPKLTVTYTAPVDNAILFSCNF